MVTGSDSMDLKRPAKSARCMGSSFLRAARRSFSLSARIMARMCSMRSSAKNMCSVRQRPMPSAPNRRACLASRGMSALARMRRRRTGSTQVMNLTRSGSSGWASRVLSWPAMTRPVVPSSEIQSPCLKVWPLTRSSFLASSTVQSPAPATQHLPMPRVTTAACEVMPPREVRMPEATSMPAMSSGVVSPRTRMMDLVGAVGVVLDGILGGEDDLSDGRAGRSRQAGGEDFDLLALFDQAGNQEVVELVGLDAEDGFFLGDEAFVSPCRWRRGRRPGRCACRCGSAACRACRPGW